MRHAKRWLYLVHRWLGVLLCSFFAMWFVSGLVMMYVGYPKLTHTERLEHLPPGVDADRFRPDPAARAELRARYGLGERPTVVCVSRLVPRKGQDMLIKALPDIRRRVDGARNDPPRTLEANLGSSA